MTVRWSDAALELFDLRAPTAVSAGAGSGKTTALVELCVRLLSGEALGAPCEPGELVAIPFTERAGAELGERLRANGRQWVETHYNWRTVYAQWDAVYAKATCA